MNTPAEIAREALRQLATRRVPPTPDNYCSFYKQIAEVREGAADAEDANGLPCTERAPLLQELLAELLETVQRMAERQPALSDELGSAARATRYATSEDFAGGLLERVRSLMPRLRQAAAESDALHDGLVRLLQLMLRTTRDMTVEDAAVDDLLASLERLLRQIDLHAIQQAEQNLREVLVKHGVLKHGLEEVKNTLKDMAARFVDSLAAWTETTGDYHDKLAGYAERIARADRVDELGAVLQEVMRETRLVQDGAIASRRELEAARSQVDAAQERIRGLEQDLERATRRMREDALTGMLNRYGVESDFEREAARSDRHGQPLCVALLDVDDFKRLNDAYGHQGGDQALVYLAGIMRQTARKSDIVARFGGEEFLILLPNTVLEAAQSLIVRLQRALTRHLFLHKNEHVLITFSCGVAQRQPGESREAIIERVDKALYRAKRAGKNRVYTAAIEAAA